MVSPRSKAQLHPTVPPQSGAPSRAFASEDSCDSQNTPSSCSSDTQERASDGSKVQPISYVCRWKDCNFMADEPEVFYTHLRGHAQAGLKGAPCGWDACNVSNSRATRHESRFMEHHIKTHMPKKQFRCLINPCNKAFDTPEELNNHMVNHPKPKKNDRPDFKLDDPFVGQFRSSVISSTGAVEEQEQRRRVLQLQEYLRDAGIIYVAYHNEYLVKVHLQPIGLPKKTADGREQRYRICYPFVPTWVKEVFIQCALETENPETIVYELALSNPIFREPMRWFVKHLEQEISRKVDVA